MTRNSAKHRKTSPPTALKALQRAAKNALELGRQSGTPVYAMENGKIIDVVKATRATKIKQRRVV